MIALSAPLIRESAVVAGSFLFPLDVQRSMSDVRDPDQIGVSMFISA